MQIAITICYPIICPALRTKVKPQDIVITYYLKFYLHHIYYRKFDRCALDQRNKRAVANLWNACHRWHVKKNCTGM